MGIRVFVFDERVGLAQADYVEWVESEISAAPKDGWDQPEASSPSLRKWFYDMCKTFARDGHLDDPHSTPYCFYQNVIEVEFGSSVEEEGVLEAWRLAEKHGVRLLAGGA